MTKLVYYKNEELGRWINRLRFKSNVWEAYDVERAITMAIQIRKALGLEYVDRNSLYNGAVCNGIFAYRYEDALAGFKRMIMLDF